MSDKSVIKTVVIIFLVSWHEFCGNKKVRRAFKSVKDILRKKTQKKYKIQKSKVGEGYVGQNKTQGQAQP